MLILGDDRCNGRAVLSTLRSSSATEDGLHRRAARPSGSSALPINPRGSAALPFQNMPLIPEKGFKTNRIGSFPILPGLRIRWKDGPRPGERKQRESQTTPWLGSLEMFQHERTLVDQFLTIGSGGQVLRGPHSVDGLFKPPGFGISSGERFQF